MGRIFFFIAEAFRALRRSAAPSLAAIVTVVITTLLLGRVRPGDQGELHDDPERAVPARALRLHVPGRHHQAGEWRPRSEINKIPHVERTDYVSKPEGLKQLRAEVGKGAIGQGITQLHGKNPLPLAVIVHPDDADNLSSIQNAIVPPGSERQAEADQPGHRGGQQRPAGRRQDPHGDRTR